METVTGTVEAVRKDQKGLKLQNDGWYGAFKPEMLNGAQKGEEVEITYKENGQYKNIQGNVKRLGAGSAPSSAPAGGGSRRNFGGNSSTRSFPVGKNDGGRAINRQNALTNAVNFIINKETKAGITPEAVIDIARQFEAYTCGDLDAQEAEDYTDE